MWAIMRAKAMPSKPSRRIAARAVFENAMFCAVRRALAQTSTAVADLRTTSVRILRYTLMLWALTLLFNPVAGMGPIYLVAAIVLGALFTAMAVQLLRTGDTAVAMRLFSYSITYVTLLFAAMAIDSVVRGVW